MVDQLAAGASTMGGYGELSSIECQGASCRGCVLISHHSLTNREGRAWICGWEHADGLGCVSLSQGPPSL